MMIFSISQEQLDKAKSLYEFKALKNSITKGESNIFGALGEVLVYDFVKNKGLNVLFQSTYDYDMTINGYKIDVKTKKTTVVPQPHYLCSIASINTTQDCDYYFFARIDESLVTGYLLGYKAKKDFYSQATFNKKGEIDVNGWAFKADCYNLKVKDLDKFR